MQKRTVIKFKSARRDLKEIYLYLRKETHSLEITQSFLTILEKQIEKLNNFPHIGIKVRRNKKQYYQIICRNYKIYYTITTTQIKIHRVIHTARHTH